MLALEQFPKKKRKISTREEFFTRNEREEKRVRGALENEMYLNSDISV